MVLLLIGKSPIARMELPKISSATLFPLPRLKSPAMANTITKLTDEQKTTLDGFTDTYSQASCKERKGILKDALAALFPAVPDNDKDGKKRRKERVATMTKVMCIINASISMLIAQNYRWLHIILETMVEEKRRAKIRLGLGASRRWLGRYTRRKWIILLWMQVDARRDQQASSHFIRKFWPTLSLRL